MGRINNRPLDPRPDLQDKLLGTRSEDQFTRNYTLEEIAELFADHGVTDASRTLLTWTHRTDFPDALDPDNPTNDEIVGALQSGEMYVSTSTIADLASPAFIFANRRDVSNQDGFGLFTAILGGITKVGGASASGVAYAIYEVGVTSLVNDSEGEPTDIMAVILTNKNDDNGVHITDGIHNLADGEFITFLSLGAITGDKGDQGFQGVGIVPGQDLNDGVTITPSEPTTFTVDLMDPSGATTPTGVTFTVPPGADGFSVSSVDITSGAGKGDDGSITITTNIPGQETISGILRSGTQGFQGVGIAPGDYSDPTNPGLGQESTITIPLVDPAGTVTGNIVFTVQAGEQGIQGYQGIFDIKVFQVALIADDRPDAPVGGSFNLETGDLTNPTGWVRDFPDYDHTTQIIWESRVTIDPASYTTGDTLSPWAMPFQAGAQGPTGNTGPGYVNVTLTNNGDTLNFIGENTPDRSVTGVKGDQGVQGVGVNNLSGNQDGVATSTTQTTVTVTGTDPSTGATNVALGTFEVPSGVQGIQGQRGEGLEVREYDTTTDSTLTTVTLQGVDTNADGGTFDVLRGVAGTSIYAQSGTPASNSQAGNEGDVYVNTFNGEVWNYTSGNWVDSGSSLEGPKGDQGTSISSGNAVPSNATGNDGDVFIDVQTGFVYNKVAGVWQAVVGETLKGPKGDPSNVQGPQGIYQVFVFQKADTTPSAPTGGVWNPTTLQWTTLPTGWFASPADDSTGANTYESFALFDPDNTGNTLQWVDPFVAGQQGTAGANAILAGDGVAGVTTVPNKGDGTVGDATVTQSGNAQNIDFTFGIPQGIKGDPGTAATVDVGNTVTLSSGSTASVTNTGDTTNAVFNFGIPIGLPGAAAGFGTISAATGPVGVVETGPDTAKNLAFTIPAGERGESIEVDESATVTTATETTVTLRTTDTNTAAGTFAVQRGVQGAQGFYSVMVYTSAPNPGANVPAPDANTGSGITTPPTHTGFTWSFTPPAISGSEAIFISSAVYDPTSPTAALSWSDAYLASGGTGAQGPQGVQGPPGIQGPRGLRGFDGIQGVQGLYNLFIYRLAPTDSIAANIQPVLGSGIVAAPADWSFDPVSTTVPDGMSIWISSGLYNPAIPQAAIDWGLPFIASGEPGVPGPQGEPGVGIAAGGSLGQALVSNGVELGSTWATFTSGYNSTHQQIGFQSNGSTILASVDLSGYTPLNPSGGSGGPTSSSAFIGVVNNVPTAFVQNSALTVVAGDASDGQSFTFTYTGTTDDQWAIINLPDDLTLNHTIGFNFRDPQSGFTLPVVPSDIVFFNGATYNTYAMSFGRTVDIITHIS